MDIEIYYPLYAELKASEGDQISLDRIVMVIYISIYVELSR
jgi:hypothetical protein